MSGFKSCCSNPLRLACRELLSPFVISMADCTAFCLFDAAFYASSLPIRWKPRASVQFRVSLESLLSLMSQLPWMAMVSLAPTVSWSALRFVTSIGCGSLK